MASKFIVSLVTAAAALQLATVALASSKTSASVAGLLTDFRIEGVKIESSHGEFYSKAVIGFNVQCYQKLQAFQASVANDQDGNVTIYAAALTKQADHNGSNCLAFKKETREVMLGLGAYDAEKITVVAVASAPADIAPTALGGFLTDKITVVATKPLCPAGVMCITNGTIVTFAVTKYCAQQSGPFAAALNTATNGDQPSVVVAAAVFNDSRQRIAFCRRPEIVEYYTESFNMQFWDSPADVNLNILASQAK